MKACTTLILFSMSIFPITTSAMEGLTGIDSNTVRDWRAKENQLLSNRATCAAILSQKILSVRSRLGGYPVRGIVDRSTGSIRIEPENGLTELLSSAEGRVLFLHGLGMDYSGPYSWAQHISTLVKREGAKNSSTAGFLQTLPTYMRLAPEAIDLPGSTSAYPIELLYHYDYRHLFNFFDSPLGPVIRNIVSKLKTMRRETPNLPIYVVGRSAYGRILPEINNRYPKLIDKMILI